MKKINVKLLVINIAIPLVVGGLSALLSMAGMKGFETVNKPPLTPAGWLFPVVWTILYIMMGISSYLVLNGKPSKYTGKGIIFYALQLAFNFFWSIFFFKFSLYTFSFVWLLVLLGLIIATIYCFYKVEKCAGYILIPYLVWVTFAGYLTLGTAILN